MIFNKASFGKNGFKYFIDYKNNEKLNRLHIVLPKIIG